jgi:hypothetical protein
MIPALRSYIAADKDTDDEAQAESSNIMQSGTKQTLLAR